MPIKDQDLKTKWLRQLARVRGLADAGKWLETKGSAFAEVRDVLREVTGPLGQGVAKRSKIVDLLNQDEDGGALRAIRNKNKTATNKFVDAATALIKAEPVAGGAPPPPAEEKEPPPPPPAEEQQPPPPPSGKFDPSIFYGDSLSKYSTVQPRDGTITQESSGDHIITMKPSNSTGVAISGNPRDEVISSKFWGANAHVCVGVAMRLPQGSQAGIQKFSGDSTFCAFFQFFGTPWDGSPPLKCEVFDKGTKMGWQRNVTGGWKREWDAPLRFGSWINLVYDITLGSGVGVPAPVKTYLDGKQIHAANVPVFDAGSRDGKLCARMMLYRKKDVYDGVIPIEFKPLAEGPTPESVMYV